MLHEAASHAVLESFCLGTLGKQVLTFLEDAGEPTLLELVVLRELHRDIVFNPGVPLEERLPRLLAELEEFVLFRLHLNELLLLRVRHDLRYERHLEEFLISILPATLIPQILLLYSVY